MKAARPILPGVVLVGVAFLLMSCKGSQDVGEVYRAERDLWRTNAARRSAARQNHPSSWQWKRELLGQYEALASYCLGGRRGHAPSSGMRAVAGRALLEAAELRLALLDSMGVDELLADMNIHFASVPVVMIDVVLRRGKIAEGWGDVATALGYYEEALELARRKGGAQPSTAVPLHLPLRMARMRSALSGGELAVDEYERAKAYYDGLLAHPSRAVQVHARDNLAAIEADFGRWDQALAVLKALELQLQRWRFLPKHPAIARHQQIRVRRDAGEDPLALVAATDSLLDRYPRASTVPYALMTVAEALRDAGRIDQARTAFDRIGEERPGHELVPEALLAKARMLERAGRLDSAVREYELLNAQYLLSDAGLRAPMEIVRLLEQTDDRAALRRALTHAEETYRDFLARYPPSHQTPVARRHLIRCLAMQGRAHESIGMALDLAEEIPYDPRTPELLLTAARIARDELQDLELELDILERIVERYPSTRIGSWCAEEAGRLRQKLSQ